MGFKIQNSKILMLWGHLSTLRHKQFYLLMPLMIIASLSEVISIGAILPFIGVLTDPEQLYQHELLQPIVQYFELTSPNQLILPLTVAFIIATLFAGAVRLTLLYATTRLSYAAGADLSIEIYRRTLYQVYSVHVARNSSEIINGIITKTGSVIGGVFTPVLLLISSSFMLTSIIFALFAINIVVALTAMVGFGILYWGVIRYTRHQLIENSKSIAENSDQMIKSLQEGLGGIRDVLIDGSQQFYCQLYRNADLPLRRAAGNNLFISSSPKFVMEAIGMSMISSLAYLMAKQGGLGLTTLPVLGAIALGAQKLLPALQQAYSAYSTIKSANQSLQDVIDLLEQPLPSYVDKITTTPIKFEEKIKLNNVSFRYTKDSPWVLKDINLKITKGARVGFMGVTGKGKSTLLDIIMGLLHPTIGNLSIDDQPITRDSIRTWQAHIAHVPQHIYLSDSTIEENIAFSIPKEKINHQLLEKAAHQAQIADMIEDWREGYQTFVGERGVRLSGGQRQRIGIARALYKQSNVLIFDEATSALDNETEEDLMEAIEGLGRELTILIIAHRLTTLKMCDQIIKLDKNNAIYAGSYQNIINESKSMND